MMKVGDLVKYKYDPPPAGLSKKTYLVETVDPTGGADFFRGHRYATLLGWQQLNAAGLVQRFRFDQLELVSSCK